MPLVETTIPSSAAGVKDGDAAGGETGTDFGDHARDDSREVVGVALTGRPMTWRTVEAIFIEGDSGPAENGYAVATFARSFLRVEREPCGVSDLLLTNQPRQQKGPAGAGPSLPPEGGSHASN